MIGPTVRNPREELRRAVRSVRNRWRLRIAVRGVAILLSVALGLFLFSSLVMDHFRFAGWAVVSFRLLTYLAIVGVAVRFLILPLIRQVSDEQVALYLEENEPELGGELVSAVEFGREERGGSAALVERLVHRAARRCATIEYGRRVERPRLVRSSGLLAGATVMGAAVLLLQPGFLRHAAPFLLAPWTGGATGSPYWIEVAPGDVAVARGADVKVTARLHNFDSDEVEVVILRGDSAEWERWPMDLDRESGRFLFVMFDLDDHTEYFVESGGVRSRLHTVEVRDLPYVERIDLEYRFPEYTGMSPLFEEDGGDIAAVVGTEVVVTVTPTIPVSGGGLVVDETDTVPLQRLTSGGLAGTITVEREALYRVLLATDEGDEVVASPDYYIDPLSDQPPSVSFREPGRDLRVTNVDEVFVEVTAEDDFGLRAVSLIFAVNGGAPDTVVLHRGGASKQVVAGHTFFLEELRLSPGDLVSYFAEAIDGNSVSGLQTAATDIYFLEIRPFEMRYRQAAAQGGGGGGGGGDMGDLSRRQRDIVAATFKIVRDSAEYEESELRENLATLALAQGRLREEVARLVGRIDSRRIAQLDSSFQTVAQDLSQAVGQMEGAEEMLGERRPRQALSPEQRALQHLQRAEAAYRERQVSFGSGGGGGAGGQATSEELADLFDLEMDRLRNQYEQVQRGERQQVDEELDAALERLRELARRQQQENERMRARAQSSGGGAGASRSQRALAEEAEQLARQLQRLAREQSRPELEETARQLRDAVNAMRRAAARGESGVAQGQSALDRLREARRLLEQDRAQSLRRDVADALRRAERLGREQREVTGDVTRLDGDGAERGERLRRLIQRKNEMAGEVRDLESEINRLSRDARRGQPDAARELREAFESMRDARLADKILYSRGVVQGRSIEYARNFEEQISSDIENLERELRQAVDAIGESREQRLGRALDRARDVVSGLGSLEERLRQAGQEREEGEQGQRGQRGQAEAEAREGGRGQEGEGSSGRRGPSPDRARQFQRELGERRNELRDIRRELANEGVDVTRLDEVIRGLGRLDNRGLIGDPRGLDQLRAEIIPGLQEFEYSLRRELEGTATQELFLSGSDAVPAEYRELVQEYYRALARRRR